MLFIIFDPTNERFYFQLPKKACAHT